MKLNPFQHIFLLRAKNCISTRDWLLEALTVMESYTNEVEIDPSEIPNDLSPGTKIIIPAVSVNSPSSCAIVRLNKKYMGWIEAKYPDEETYEFIYLNEYGRPLLGRKDVFKLVFNEDTIWKNSPPVVTTVGRYIENMICLGFPFDGKIPYQNNRWSPGAIGSIIADAAGEELISVDELQHFMDNVFFLNHMTELCTPTLTEKSLLTNPEVPKLKAKFIAEHQGEMNDPLVTVQLENELQRLDKEFLGDDPSVRFFNALGSKSYDVHRKKLFLTVGCIDAFDVSAGKYEFVPNSLMEGWTKEAFPTICNEIRKGSYSRGTETAKGGAETKFLMRIFQDLAITEADCGTKRALWIDFKICDINLFIDRIALTGEGEAKITKHNADQFRGKKVRVRSPQTCETVDGLCFACCGDRYRKLNARAIGIESISITSTYMLISMKNMHGTKIQTINLKLEDILL